MYSFVKIVLVLNVLQNDGECLPEMYLKHLNEIEVAPYFRVYYGVPAKEKEFPYQVSMKKPIKTAYYTFCGGTIIAPSKVLSAAHCFYNKRTHSSCASVKQSAKSLTNLFAVAGTLLNKEYAQRGVNAQWRRICRTVAPVAYDFPRRDIAIVFTSKPFTYNDHVSEIPYAKEEKSYQGLKCVASGYGQTEKNGDSGGPLVCLKTGHANETNKGILIGIACGKRENKTGSLVPGASFFTRVSSYQKFIENKNTILVPDLTLWISAFNFALQFFNN